MKTMKRKGFTLVELLVVIAILAILATVSVVGYTSFIEGTAVQVDEDLANQLNHFLAAHQVNNCDDVTPDNIWKVTDQILDLGSIEEIKPAALEYGYHLYFKFDKDANGNYIGGEYVVAKDKDVIASPLMHWTSAAKGPEDPGFFEYNGALYFLIDTTGSNLADAVRGFYTFDHFEGDKWQAFQDVVAKAAAEGHANISAALDNSLFVTQDGPKATGTTAGNVVILTDPDIVWDEVLEDVTVTVDEPIVIPENVSFVSGEVKNSVNATEPSDDMWQFEKTKEELKDAFDAEFGTFVDGSGNVCNTNDDGEIVDTVTGDKVKITITNYVTDFDIQISATENKYYNSILENELNIPYIVWDAGSFTLKSEDLVFAESDKPATSKKINWEVVSLNAPEGVTLTDADKACVVFDGKDTFTLTKNPTTGLYPNIISITVKGTVAHVAEVEEGETPIVPATHEFTINVTRIDTANFSFGGNSVVNGSVDVLWGEKGDGSHFDSYALELVSHTGNDGFNLDYDTTMTITADWADTAIDGTNLTFNNVFDELGNTEKTQVITVTVNVGGYAMHSINVNVNHAKFLFEAATPGLKFVGAEGAKLKASDLFKQSNADATYSNVLVSAYIVPQTGESQSIQNLNENYTLPTTAEDAIYDGIYANVQSTTLDGEFEIDLLNSEIPVKIIFVVTVDGVRASENYEITVNGKTNVRDYASITDLMDKTAKNSSGVNTYPLTKDIILLSDITMSGDINYFAIPAGITLYGNGFDFYIKAGRRSEEGIINLAGTIRDVRIIGSVYGSFAGTVGDDCGSSCVNATGNAYIYNCYIANTRSPLRTSGNTIVEDSTFFGGRYSNIDVTGGTLTIRGKVTLVQQQYSADGQSNVIGLGISAWFNDNKKAVVVESGATFKQYNFMASDVAESLPALSYSGVELVQIKDLFGSLFTDTYKDYQFTHNNVKYVNSGIVALDMYMLNYTVAEEKMESGCLSGRYKITIKIGSTAISDTETFTIVGPSGKYYYFPEGTAGDDPDYEDFNGSINVTGAQLKQGVEFATQGKNLNFTSGSLSYEFLVKSDNYETLTVTGAQNYKGTTYDYNMGGAFGLASAFLDQFHGSGIHYNHLLVDVNTPDRDNTDYKTMLEEYLAIVANNYYTPENYQFNAQGKLNNYSK